MWRRWTTNDYTSQQLLVAEARRGFPVDSWQNYWGFPLTLNKLNKTSKAWAWNHPYHQTGPWHGFGASLLMLFQTMPKHSLGIDPGQAPSPIDTLDVATVIWGQESLALWIQAISCQLASRKILWLILFNSWDVVNVSRSSFPSSLAEASSQCFQALAVWRGIQQGDRSDMSWPCSSLLVSITPSLWKNFRIASSNIF